MGCQFVFLDCFSSFLVFLPFFFLFLGWMLVLILLLSGRPEAGGRVDDGGCLMIVTVGVVLRDDSVKRNDYFIQ